MDETIYTNPKGRTYKIVELLPNARCKVKFTETGTIAIGDAYNARNGNIKDPYAKDVYGVASLGVADKNIKFYKKAHSLWSHMIQRCYTEMKKDSHYRKTKVSERWLCFENFIVDIQVLPGFNQWLVGPMELDKDILGDSTIYAREYCMFITKEQNRREQAERKIANDRAERLGTIHYNGMAKKMKVVEYINAKEVIVEFLDSKNRRKTTFSAVKKGNVMDKNVGLNHESRD